MVKKNYNKVELPKAEVKYRIIASIAFVTTTIGVVLIFLSESVLTSSKWARILLEFLLIGFPIVGFSSGSMIISRSRSSQMPIWIIRRGWAAVIISSAVLLLLVLLQIIYI